MNTAEQYSLEKLMHEVQVRLADERMDVDVKDFKLQKRRILLSEMVRLAVSGDVDAKSYIKSRISKILINLCDITNETINHAINFYDIPSLPYSQKLHILLSKHDIGDVLSKYAHKYEESISEEIFDYILNEEVGRSELNLGFMEKLNVLTSIIYAEVYGLSVIDCMEFSDVNEIGVNGCSYIWLQYRGRKLWLRFLQFDDNETLNNVCKNAVSYNSKFDLSPSNPGVICQRHDGSRITCSLQPFYSEPTLNLRRFNLGNFDASRLISLGTFDEETAGLLKLLVRGRANIIISGAMGDGKSTTLMSLIGFVPDTRSIGTIEENFELRLKNRYPSKNVIEAQAISGKGVSAAFEFMLKQARDIIILGEITNSEEASLLINVMLRLCRGSMGTFHSESAHAVVINLRNLLLKSGSYQSEMVAQADVVEAVNIVVQMSHDGTGRRYVESISEIVPDDAAYGCGFSVRELVIYEKGSFIRKNDISEALYKKLCRYSDELKSDNSEYTDINNHPQKPPHDNACSKGGQDICLT